MFTINQIAHREYLKSATWKDIREEILKRDDYKCQKCGNTGYDVHHKTYKNWGNEKLEDLITLCRTCHEQWHETEKTTRKSKSIGTRAIWSHLNNKQKEILKNEFNLTDNTLYNSINLSPNKEICLKAAGLLGYDNWYSQVGKFTEECKSKKSKRQIFIKESKENN